MPRWNNRLQCGALRLRIANDSQYGKTIPVIYIPEIRAKSQYINTLLPQNTL
jgi:hypothetical protein